MNICLYPAIDRETEAGRSQEACTQEMTWLDSPWQRTVEHSKTSRLNYYRYTGLPLLNKTFLGHITEVNSKYSSFYLHSLCRESITS